MFGGHAAQVVRKAEGGDQWSASTDLSQVDPSLGRVSSLSAPSSPHIVTTLHECQSCCQSCLTFYKVWDL